MVRSRCLFSSPTLNACHRPTSPLRSAATTHATRPDPVFALTTSGFGVQIEMRDTPAYRLSSPARTPARKAAHSSGLKTSAGLCAHHVGAADDPTDHGLVQNGPELGCAVGCQPLAPRGPDRDLPLDGLLVVSLRLEFVPASAEFAVVTHERGCSRLHKRLIVQQVARCSIRYVAEGVWVVLSTKPSG